MERQTEAVIRDERSTLYCLPNSRVDAAIKLLTTENKLTVKGASILANVINSAVADVYDETLVSNLENSGTFKAYNKVVLTNVLNKTSSKIEVVDEVVVDLITNEGEFTANKYR